MLILSLILIAVGVAADQAVKFLVVENLRPDGVLTAIPGLLDFVYVENTGAAFGMFGDYTWILSVVTAVLVVVVLFCLLFYRNHSFFSRTAGILIDRIRLEYVIDYIRVSFFPPVFNLADCFVVVGVILFFIHILFFMDRDHGRERIIRTRR
mgnify:CR=1 FL=1